MANQEHLDLLKKGEQAWNRWRQQFPEIQPDLSEVSLGFDDLSGANLSRADLRGAFLYRFIEDPFRGADFGTPTEYELSDSANLSGADLSRADLRGANLSEVNLKGAVLSEVNLYKTDLHKIDLRKANLSRANLWGANLSKANLSKANLSEASIGGANLSKANLWGADLRGANLSGASLSGTDLSRADLRGTNLSGVNLSGVNLSKVNLSKVNLSDTNLSRALLIETNFTGATLNNCRVYGTAVWNVNLQEAKQDNLIITPDNEATITVDTLEIAQFVYLLLNNGKIRDVINTLTTKAVLILGRFTSERKAVLDAIRDKLRKHNYLPILFDFEKPLNRDITETVTILARLSRFIVADLTDPRSIPQELDAIVPHLPSVPVQPLLLSSQSEYGMFEHFTRYPWVLPIFRYADQESLLQSLKEHVIDPAEQKAQELAKRYEATTNGG